MTSPRGKKWLENATAVLDKIREMRIPIHAASACYFIVLSVFPAAVLILGLLRYTRFQVADLVTLLDGIVPDVLMSSVERVLNSTFENSSAALISLSALTTLWSASRGVYGLAVGIDAVYGADASRPYLQRRGLCLLYTFLFILVLLLTLVLHVFGNTILSLLAGNRHGFFGFLMDVIDLRFFLLTILQTALFAAMFMFLPSRRNRLRDSLPGALLASIGWLVFSDMFSMYVEHFSNYATVYGSMYTVAIAMLWLYFCISIVFYGGALNRFFMDDRFPPEK